jgi:hypothetical protein
MTYTFTVMGDSTSPTSYESWIAQYPELSGPDAERGADPDQDGLPNLLELVLDFNPAESDLANPSYPQMYVSEGTLRLQFYAPPGNIEGTQIEFYGETSTDLVNWSRVDPEDLGGNIYEISAPVDEEPRKFLRLVAGDPEILTD